MAKTYVQINTTKSKENMYNWIKEIFVQTNDINNFNEEYEYYSIGVKYNNGTSFVYDIQDGYDVRYVFYNYFIEHNIDEISHMFIYNWDLDVTDKVIYIYGGTGHYDMEYNDEGKVVLNKLTKSISDWFYKSKNMLNCLGDC